MRIKVKKEAFYHVMTKTAQASFCLDNQLKKQIYQRIQFLSKIYYITPLAMAVMSNHYHVCVHVAMPEFNKEEVKKRFELLQESRAYPKVWNDVMAPRWHRRFSDLSKFMWELNRSIAWAHNKKAKTWGHFWGAPYKSHLVEQGTHLLTVMKYIDMNPVRAGMVKEPGDYPFSSAGRLAHPSFGPHGVTLSLCNQLSLFPREKQAQMYLNMLNQMPHQTKHKEKRGKREHNWDSSNWTRQCFGSYGFETAIRQQAQHRSLVRKCTEPLSKSTRGSPA